MNNLANIIPDFIIRQAVEEALQEDLGRAGDLTSNSVIPEDLLATGILNSRHTGIVSGIRFAERSFKTLSPEIEFTTHIADGSPVNPGDRIATIKGPGRALLTAERVALNYLGHLSGIASLTNLYVKQTEGTKASVCCTRKTTPGLRAFEKYAVKCGGGMNHRFGLDDAVMIKDNHIAIAGSISEAVKRARENTGHNVKIEVEVDTLQQLGELLKCNADIVLLDNMSPQMLTEAVNMIDGKMLAEASGGVNLDTVKAIADTGVDLISVGALTHSAPVLDIGLDFNTL